MKLFRSMLALALAAVMMLTVSVGFAASAATVLNLNEVENPAFKGGAFTTTEDGLGFTADLSTSTPEGWGYLHINLHPYVADTPYLAYQITENDGSFNRVCYDGLWSDGEDLVIDGERHVINLSAHDGENLYIMTTMNTVMNFPLAYLTDDPDADPTQTTGGTTGGNNTQTGAESAVAVAAGAVIAAAGLIVLTKKK